VNHAWKIRAFINRTPIIIVNEYYIAKIAAACKTKCFIRSWDHILPRTQKQKDCKINIEVNYFFAALKKTLNSGWFFWFIINKFIFTSWKKIFQLYRLFFLSIYLKYKNFQLILKSLNFYLNYYQMGCNFFYNVSHLTLKFLIYQSRTTEF
jgi:hypothetical protein